MKGITAAALFLVASSATTLKAQQHFPTNEDLRQLRSISNPQLSPDLKHVVATMQDSTADGGKSHLWLLSTEGGAYRQLTFSQDDVKGERTPEYLPDGSAILFISKHKDKTNLYRLPLDGGDAVAVKLEHVPATGEAAADVDVVSYAISPDGNTVAVVATDPEPAARTKDHKDKKDVAWEEHEELKPHLYLLDTKTWKANDVPTLTDIDAVAWTPQSDRLLVLTHTRIDDLGPSTAGWIVEAKTPAQQTRIAGLPETTERAAWMHQGNRLALFAQCEKDAPPGCAEMFTFDIATGKLHNLTVGLKDSTLSADTLLIADDDRTALITASHGMRRTVAQVDLMSGKEKLLDFGLPVVSTFRQRRGASAWVYMASSSTSAPAVYIDDDARWPGQAACSAGDNACFVVGGRFKADLLEAGRSDDRRAALSASAGCGWKGATDRRCAWWSYGPVRRRLYAAEQLARGAGMGGARRQPAWQHRLRCCVRGGEQG